MPAGARLKRGALKLEVYSSFIRFTVTSIRFFVRGVRVSGFSPSKSFPYIRLTTPDIYDFVTDSKSHFHPKSPDSLPGLVEFFLQLLLPLRYQIDVRNLGYTVSLLLALFTALSLVRFLKIPILFDI